MSCSRCGQEGHNLKSCKNPPKVRKLDPGVSGADLAGDRAISRLAEQSKKPQGKIRKKRPETSPKTLNAPLNLSPQHAFEILLRRIFG
jgi:hypothetical protein